MSKLNQMWLLFDLLLDGVRELVIDLATVPEVFFDFLLVIHLDLLAFVVLLFPLVSKRIDLSLLELFTFFIRLIGFFLLFARWLLLDCFYFAFVLL